MKSRTRELWALQDRPAGDRVRLFRAAASFADTAGKREVVAEQPGSLPDPAIRFVHADTPPT